MRLLLIPLSITFCILAGFICGHAAPKALPDSAALAAARLASADSLQARLAAASTPADSLPILYDLYDLSDHSKRHRFEIPLYGAATRSDNNKARLDVLRLIANSYLGNDSAQNLVLEEALTLPDNDEKKETVTFIRLLIVTTKAMFFTPEDKEKYLHDALSRFSEKSPEDNFESLELLYSVCLYLGSSVQGEMLQQYLDQSEQMISSLPYGLYALRNMFYAHTAIIYSNGLDYERAAASDKALLSIMAKMEKKYAEEGREFKNYRVNRYICYRRLLSNYPALSRREIEDYHSRIADIAAVDPDVAADLAENRLADIYYLMATGDYARALPLLKVAADKDFPGAGYTRHRLFRMLVDAAEATGDNTTLHNALLTYNKLLEERLRDKSDERYRELQIIYDVDRLKSTKAALEIAARDREAALHRSLMIIAIIFAVVMAALCIILFRLYHRYRSLANDLKHTNARLTSESETLRTTQESLIAARDQAAKASRLKSEFISNMSYEVREPLEAIAGYTQLIVDSIPDSRRAALDNYAKIVALNTDLVLTLVNDVLCVNTIEKNMISIVRKDVSVNSLCELAVQSVAHRMNPQAPVSMTYAKADEPDIIIHTDPRRVDQVLINLLLNAIKFTAKGSIVLDYSLDDAARTITFSVTDTGCGVPADKAETIFKRFEKINSSTQGIGLGLPVCRLTARLLKGSVILDTTYPGPGARFLFTVPV